jgi:hypothetical protein
MQKPCQHIILVADRLVLQAVVKITREENWKYSSARDLCGMKELVELSYS